MKATIALPALILLTFLVAGCASKEEPVDESVGLVPNPPETRREISINDPDPIRQLSTSIPVDRGDQDRPNQAFTRPEISDTGSELVKGILRPFSLKEEPFEELLGLLPDTPETRKRDLD